MNFSALLILSYNLLPCIITLSILKLSCVCLFVWCPSPLCYHGHTLISLPNIKIMTQDMIIGVYQVHLWCQERPCPPSLLSGTLNVLQVPPLRTDGSWHISNHAGMLKFGTQVGNPMSRTIIRSKTTNVLHVSGQEPSMSSKSLIMRGGILAHF